LSTDRARRARGPGDSQISMAGGLAGVAAGGFLVTWLSYLELRTDWFVQAYEPAAALLGALGVYLFSTRHEIKEGLLAMAAALLAMLLGDVFRARLVGAWTDAPVEVLRSFRVAPWAKGVRYGFGLYVGWYLGSADLGRPAAGGEVDEE